MRTYAAFPGGAAPGRPVRCISFETIAPGDRMVNADRIVEFREGIVLARDDEKCECPVAAVLWQKGAQWTQSKTGHNWNGPWISQFTVPSAWMAAAQLISISFHSQVVAENMELEYWPNVTSTDEGEACQTALASP